MGTEDPGLHRVQLVRKFDDHCTVEAREEINNRGVPRHFCLSHVSQEFQLRTKLKRSAPPSRSVRSRSYKGDICGGEASFAGHLIGKKHLNKPLVMKLGVAMLHSSDSHTPKV